MEKTSKIYIAGHRGMVGSAIVRKLKRDGFENLILRTSAELDLRNQSEVKAFMMEERPDYVFLAAAKVGGIVANNTYRADFIYENLAIQNNVIHFSKEAGVKKLMFLGSSCIYPKLAPQPMKEEYLLTGPLEPTNEPYAIAKIAGIKMCDAYRDQYGCNFVLPALLSKFHQAKEEGKAEVEVWGSGTPKREFLHADDMADACVFLMQTYNEPGLVNIGVGEDISIKDLALLVKDIVGFDGKLHFDASKPDGTPRKLMDVSKLHGLGWKARIGLREGITEVYRQQFITETV
jgi:GDP-L-fucose synthase